MSGTKSGKVTFSDYNKVFSISAPSHAVDLDRLQSLG